MANDKTINLLEDVGTFLIIELANDLMRKKKNASKSLINSLKMNVEATDNGYEVNITGKDYAKWVNVGRKKGSGRPTRENLRKHGVPLPALIKWVRQKGLESGDKKVVALAARIQKSIWQKGIKPTNFVEDSLKAANKVIETKVLRAMGVQVENQIDSLIKKHFA